MAHLIQPITIDGTAYCVSCLPSAGIRKHTKGVLTSDYATAGNSAAITTDCGAWLIFTGSESSNDGEVSFGVSCGTTVNIAIASTVNSGTEFGVDVEFYIDGVYDSGVFIHETNTTDTAALSITGSPCGVIITAVSNALSTEEGSYDVDVTIEVSSIT